MFNHVIDTAFIHVGGGVRLMADDEGVLAFVKKFPARTTSGQHFVTQIFQKPFQLIPLDVRRRRL